MSRKRTGANAQKGFAVGRGLLAGAETLNFSMGESHSDPYGSSSRSRSRSRSGLVGGEGKDHDSPLHRRAGSHINTVQLFASLGLSSTDLDALAEVPEENLCMETLPHLLMLLKNRKMEASWGDMQGGRLDRSSGQAQSLSQGDFGYTSMQETSGRGYDMLDYRSGSGRDRQYSELSHDSYRNLGMSASSPSDDMFMQRRMGSPSQRKVQDFLGVMPLMFPHVCSLCDFDVHSVMEWTQHTTGIRHSENRKLLLQMYPDWDPQMPSSRTSTSLSLDTKSRSDRLLGADSIGGGLQRTGMSSSWGSDSSLGMTSKITSYSTAPKIKSRVIVLKYERKPKLTNSLFDLAKPFGTICKHLVLKNMNKAFLELQTHEEALAMANYYKRKPAILHGKEIQVYLSKELIAIKKSGRPVRDTRTREKKDVSQVVFFYHLPRESDKKMELLKIARRFGTVEKHLFVDKGAYVQMGNAEDAEMLVKYYTVNPLTVNGRSIRLNICTKYKTLTDPPGKDDQGREEPARKSSGSSSATSRTGDKPSSKNRRSSTSKAKERSYKKEEEPKPKEVEALGDGSGDEADVMEARDEDGCDEDPSADDVDLSCDPEQTSEQAPDIDDTNIEDEEDPEAQQARNGSSDETTENQKDETTENQKDSGEKQEETPLEEPTTSEAEQENTDELPKDLEEQNGDQPEDEGAEEDNEEQEGQTETDFPENMDEFVTLDELVEEEDTKRNDSKSKAKYTSGSSKDSRGFRVINVVGFKRGHGYKDEILALAKPFGKVVRHLVLDVRPEAFLQFSKEKEARAMVSFYARNALPSVCGKPVRVYHSHTYPTIQSGKVLYVGNVPTFKGSDATLLKIAEPFGKIRKYYLNRLRNECFIEMERGEDAEKMAEAYKEKRPKFEGKRLVVYVSRKFKQLKRGQRPPSPETEDKRTLKRERSGEDEAQRNSSGKSKDKKEEEPSVKKIKVDEPVADKAKEMESHEEKESQKVSAEIVPEEKKESEEKQSEDTSELQNMETEPEAEDEETVASEKSVKTEEKTITTAPSELKLETSHSTLEPYDPNVPVGVEFVKMGYYCRICFLFYSNEDTAKKIHCSSQAHYDKLKKYLEKEKAKAQSNGTKK
ncbi:matrin-3-like [Rhinichthys klamathensis goyatoka]|uniref:matrin-3-like n=1 Tax=Rhinichthys klamathensis goyatoka TaxID=3034132 RepID=UPI0024B6053F|nr:matrin-3-like [Rhinichthys klamathensis goyatoka]